MTIHVSMIKMPSIAIWGIKSKIGTRFTIKLCDLKTQWDVKVHSLTVIVTYLSINPARGWGHISIDRRDPWLPASYSPRHNASLVPGALRLLLTHQRSSPIPSAGVNTSDATSTDETGVKLKEFTKTCLSSKDKRWAIKRVWTVKLPEIILTLVILYNRNLDFF